MRFRKRGAAVLGLLLIALLVWLWLRPHPAAELPLKLYVAGCETLRRGPQCEYTPDKPLRLWIETAAGAELTLSAGGDSVRARADASTGTLKIRIVPGQAAQVLLVEAALGNRRTRLRYALALHKPLAWLQSANSLKKQQHYDEAERVVRDQLAGSLTLGEQALAYGMLGRIAFNRDRLEEARNLLTGAIELDHQSGQISEEANHAMALVFVMMRESAGYQDILKVLSERREPAALHAEWLARAPYYAGQAAHGNSSRGQAYKLLSEAQIWARRLDMAEITDKVPALLAQLLQELGDSQEAARIWQERFANQQPAMAQSVSCEHAFLLDSYAWGYLQALEARRDEPAAHGAVPGYPLFSQVVAGAGSLQDVLRATLTAFKRCQQPASEIARIHRNLAWAEVLGGTPQQAEAWLLAADRISLTKAPPVAQLAEQLTLHGRIAQAQGQGRPALKAYKRLEEMASQALMLESKWSAIIGQAEALRLLGEDNLAAAEFARAEALLSSPDLAVNLCQDDQDRSRSQDPHFLSGCISASMTMQRFQRGTRLYLDLLLSAGRKQEALQTLRLARARSLAAWQLARRIRKLSGAERKSWQEALGRYGESRKKSAELAAKNWHGSTENVALVEADLQAAANQANEDFRSLLKSLPTAQTQSSDLPDVSETEALFTCHSLTSRWACLARYGTRIEVLHVPNELFSKLRRCAPPPCPRDKQPGKCPPPPCRLDDAELSRSLLAPPLGPLLAQAARIRVIPVGELRLVDFERLPFPEPDGPMLINDSKEVLYSEDLPPSVDSESARPALEQALVVLDARNELVGSGLDATGRKAYGKLQQQRPTQLLAGAARAGSIDGGQSTELPATGRNVLEWLPKSGFFLYVGHNQSAVQPFGWDTELLTFDTTVRISDLLTLTAGPQYSLLFGCETGGSSIAQQIEELSMAQIFLIQGGKQVLSSVRIVDVGDANIMLRALIEQGVLDRPSDLSKILRAAQQQVRASNPKVDWSAFRVLGR